MLAEVETDKAVMELVARAAGTMLKHVVPAGATVPVSELVAVIGNPGEAVDAPSGPNVGKPAATADTPKREPPAAAAAKPEPPAAPAAKAEPPVEAPKAPPAEAAAESGRVKASPLARKIAADRGLNLQGVSGSGPQGRIVQRDLANLAAAAPAPPAPQVPVFRPGADGAPFGDVPLTQIRKTIAKRLAQSLGPVPTFYLTIEVDMERVAEAREALNALGEGKVSFNDITVKAVALALRQHPACNAWWQDDHIRYWNEIHVSMAVAIEDGLITPVIRYADQKGLRQIAAESKDLATRARERKLKPEEYTGGTFSVSNLGMLDIEEFTAIINPPEAGIIAIGRISEKPVVHEGAIVARKRMRLTMSCDHRVIDGATGAQFLRTLKGMLENPLALVW